MPTTSSDRMMEIDRPHVPPSRTVVEIDPSTDPRWDAYLAGRDDGVVFQHSAWLRTLAREYGQRPIALACETGGGRLCGILPLMWTRGLPLAPRAVAARRLASLPRTPVAGPLADDAQAAAALVGAAVERLAVQPGAQLQIKLLRPELGGLVDGVVGHPWRLTYRIDLPERVEDLRFGNSRNHGRIRWAVRKGERDGLRVRAAMSADDVRAWYPLHVRTLQPHVVPPRPLRLFLAMWEEMAPLGLMRLLLAERPGGGIVAGSVILTHGATAFYAFNGVRRDALAARPNDLIQWRAIHDAVDAGCKHYDLGEVLDDHAGLADFKRKWGAREERMHRYYHPDPDDVPSPGDDPAGPARRVAQVAWQKMPPRATRILGDLMYRYL